MFVCLVCHCLNHWGSLPIKGLTSCIFQDFYAAVCLCFKTSHPGMLTQCFSVKYFMQTDLICDGVNSCCLDFTGGTKTESKPLPVAVASRVNQPLLFIHSERGCSSSCCYSWVHRIFSFGLTPLRVLDATGCHDGRTLIPWEHSYLLTNISFPRWLDAAAVTECRRTGRGCRRRCEQMFCFFSPLSLALSRTMKEPTLLEGRASSSSAFCLSTPSNSQLSRPEQKNPPEHQKKWGYISALYRSIFDTPHSPVPPVERNFSYSRCIYISVGPVLEGMILLTRGRLLPRGCLECSSPSLFGQTELSTSSRPWQQQTGTN